MCGVAGYVGPGRVDGERVQRTLELMRHRGPDDQSHRGFDLPDGRHVDLLHARLTIIDQDPRGNQPFKHGNTWLSYNGELYNYLEVREGLERQGVPFRTSCDTEVLCAALDRGGTEALDRCEGMWGFAAFNERSGELLLCRDRFGEKPMYLLREPDGGLYFGSEAKFVFSLAGRTPPLNVKHLQRYLVNGYKSIYKTRDTFFEGVEELPSGHFLRVGADGSESTRSYWSPPRPQAAEMSFEEAVAGARERLIRSVELRLRSDVPLAFLMSGGVDSLSLISTARNVFDYDVHGFTVVNTDSRYEEQDMIDHAVEQLGVRHTNIPLNTRGFLEKLRELVRHHDAPVYTITYYVQWLLMGAVHDAGYRVSISGSAADELFSGYYDHHLAYLREVHADAELHAASKAAWDHHVKPIVRNPFLSNPDLFVDDPGFRDHIYLGADEFRTYLAADFEEPFGERSFGTDDVLRTRMLNELFHESVPVILHEDDLNAMYFSIENRSPFLDRNLFEFSLTIPTRHLVRDGKAKAVLRESMRGIAPDKILDNRRKVGFNAPIQSLFDTNDPEVRADLLAPGPLWDHLRREKIEAVLDHDGPLPNSMSKLLFNVLNAKLFLEEVV